MSVAYQHPEYERMLPKWTRCRDVSAGSDAVHNAGPMYLPQLRDQDNVDYDNYKSRATFYNATWRTIVGLQGMLFRKPPVVNVPPTVLPMLEDITQSGQPLHIFALEATEELLTSGRLGLFVDYPIVDTSTTTAADALEQNIRPLMKTYKAESIINWRTRQYKNQTVLSMIVIMEQVPVPLDEFEEDTKTQYRVLDLIDTLGPNGSPITVYRVRIMEVKEEGGELVDVLISETTPIMNGNPLDFIPFYFIGIDDMSWEIDNPPLIDLVDMNLSHYRTTADYEHGCHFTGLPTPVISGYTPLTEGGKLYIGSSAAWVFPSSEAKASYLEFKGEGLKCLESNLAQKEIRMAILGARMLEVQSKGVESADSAAIHRTGEQSMLASAAQTISLGFEKALKTFCQFANASPDAVKFALNKDFFPMPMDALTLTALIAGWQNGAYSFDTLFDNLKQGDIVPLDKTAEQEQAEIKANPSPTQIAATADLTQGIVKGNKPNVSNGTGDNKTITQLQNS